MSDDKELNSPGYDIPEELDNVVKITTLDRDGAHPSGR